MLNVSEAACAYLSMLLSKSDAPDDARIRIVIEGNKLSIKLDDEKPDDATFVHEGKTFLVMDEDISQILSSKTLDVEDSEEGLKITVKDSGGREDDTR